MKASELIKELQNQIIKHGDLSVIYLDDCIDKEVDKVECEQVPTDFDKRFRLS